MRKAARSISLASMLSVALILVLSRAGGAVPAQSEPTNVKISGRGHDEEYDVRGRHMTVTARDVYAMTGLDLDRWPYIESSNAATTGVIPGMNLMIPDGSHWGWRFISRVHETDVTTRASIDVNGNADFTGGVHSHRFQAGTPGFYTPAALTWGNHLGGDFVSTLFSSASTALYGVRAEVFGISYNNVTVLAQDAYGNVAMFGNVVAKKFSAASLQAGGASIGAGNGAPASACAIGDVYLRRDGLVGSTMYSCTAANVWSPVGAGAAPPNPALSANAVFGSRSLAAAPKATLLASVPVKLGASAGPMGDWYVCAIVDATIEGDAAGSKTLAVTLGIGSASPGAEPSFHMYSRPEKNLKNPAFDASILSDWTVGLGEATGDGVQNTTSNGRYCGTYAGQSVVSFSAYAVPAIGTADGTVYTSGQLEIQATPK